MADPEMVELVEQEWTYCGLRLGTSGKLLHEWLESDGGSGWFSKGPPGAVVGGVFKIRATSDGRKAAPSGATYLRPSEHPDAAAWRLQHEAARVDYDAVRAAKRAAQDAADGLGDLTLRQVRDLVARAVAGQRAALIATVLRYLRP